MPEVDLPTGETTLASPIVMIPLNEDIWTTDATTELRKTMEHTTVKPFSESVSAFMKSKSDFMNSMSAFEPVSEKLDT